MLQNLFEMLFGRFVILSTCHNRQPIKMGITTFSVTTFSITALSKLTKWQVDKMAS
jgi:hypothetical protein